MGELLPSFPSQVSNLEFVLVKFLQCHGQTGSAQANGCSAIPVPQHLSPQKRNCQPVPKSQCREVPAALSYSTPGTSCRLQLRPPDASYLEEVSL